MVIKFISKLVCGSVGDGCSEMVFGVYVLDLLGK